MIVPRLYFGTHTTDNRGDARALMVDRGLRDDGETYGFRGKTERSWPSGLTGENVFKTLTFAMLTTVSAVIEMQPWVDGRLVPSAVQRFDVVPGPAREALAFEMSLNVAVLNEGVEIAREGLRGASIQIAFVLVSVGIPTDREIILTVDEVDVEYDVVRESTPAGTGAPR